MKKFLLLASLFIFSSQINAQIYHKFGAGISLGANTSFVDLEKKDQGVSGRLNLDYYFTPYITLGLEAQGGKILGGNIFSDPHFRQFTNSYKSLVVNAKLSLGAIVGYTENETLASFNSLYVGTGFGAIINKMSFIVRQKPGTTYIFPGEDESVNLVVPFNIGMHIPLPSQTGIPKFMINVNFQSNVTFGEGLDGYNDASAKFKNKYPDMYTLFSIGIKYNFGPETYW